LRDARVVFNRLKPYLSLAITFLLLFFLGRYVIRNWTQLRSNSWHFDFFWLAMAFVCQFMFFLIPAFNWVIFMRWGGVQMPHSKGWWAWSRALLARYLPTPIWAMGSRIYLANQFGAPLGLSIWSYWVELGMALIAAALVALLALPLWIDGVSTGGMLVTVVLAGLMILPLSLYYVFLRQLPRWGVNLQVKFSQLWIWSMLVVVAAALYGLSHVFILASTGAPVTAAWELVGVGALSWVAGTLNIFSPGGLGTREAVLVAGLQGTLAPAEVVQLSVVMRLLSTAAELTFLGMNFLLNQLSSRHETRNM
jgi:uncharacterized membrane protein YbhN (UPF0104 family)